MTVREHLDQVLTGLSDARLSEVVDFARFLRSLDARQDQEKEEWRAFGKAQFAKAYGPNEPDYTFVERECLP